MHLLEYQVAARKTSVSAGESVWLLPAKDGEESGQLRVLMAALGLAGEAGEVCDYLKKVIGHGHPFDRRKLLAELGDVLWYVAEVASALYMGLEDVAAANLEKLRARYPQGFSTEASVNRDKGVA